MVRPPRSGSLPHCRWTRADSRPNCARMPNSDKATSIGEETNMINRINRRREHFGTSIAFVFFALVLGAIPTLAQRAAPRDPAEPAQGRPQPKLLARPAGAVARPAVDEKSMRALIGSLVACGTRLTLSSWTDSKRGIGCGRDVILARFNEIAKDSGARLQVVVDKFESSSERTSSKPIALENVYAILPGSDPKLAKTIFIVSGHFDSRPSNAMDPEADAPGADDDASGVAVSVECARLLSKAGVNGRGIYQAGLPAVRFTEPLEDYHHQHQTPRSENGVEYGDLEKYLNFTFMGDVARDNAKALQQLALAPAPPTNAKLTGAVTPDARLSWSAEDDAEGAGFEILWRETSDPRWQVYEFAASSGETILQGVSTDNHFFAVRAVGKNGARSIAVPTEIERRPPPLPAPSKP